MFWGQKQEEKIKEDLSALLALNISHLHDAANFFELLKNEIRETKSEESALRFCRAAAFHFRSLFDELKNSKEFFDSSRLKEISDSGSDLLYQKEALDLRDLIDLELLQLKQHKRIVLSDKSKSERCLINGNFSLLSKALINLIENALKYSKEEIRVELQEKAMNYQLIIHSFSSAIKESQINSGHGLNAVQEILSFHNAKLEINSMNEQSSSFYISFEKFKEKKAKQKKQKQKKSRKKIIPLALVALTTLSLITVKINQKQESKKLLNQFQEQRLQPNKELKLELEALKLALRDRNLDQIKSSYYRSLDFFSHEKQKLARYSLISILPGKNSKLLEEFIKEELRILEKDFPFSSKINALQVQQNQNKTLSQIYYLSASLGSLLIEQIHSDSELYIANHYLTELKALEFLQKLSTKNRDDFTDYNDEIAAQDAALGLDFSL